jgi:hypothetical protein
VVTCRRSGEQWPRDPALEVPCPQCGAAIGKPCKRPSQHGVWGNQPHASRDQAALDAGIVRTCPGNPHDPPPPQQPMQGTLF